MNSPGTCPRCGCWYANSLYCAKCLWRYGLKIMLSADESNGGS